MKRFFRFFVVATGLFGIMTVLLIPVAQAKKSPKIQICHIPPDDPTNLHTIIVNENAVDSHLAHGDNMGDCALNPEEVCDDHNVCTIDEFVENTNICITEDLRQATDCDDGDPNTVDSCDSAAGGCMNKPLVSAQNQNLTTNGSQKLNITLEAESLDGGDITFSIASAPSFGLLNALTPIQGSGLCSVTQTTSCTNDGECPATEECVIPPVNSASVNYTPDSPDTADSFEFRATSGVPFATAVVVISPPDQPTNPDEIATIEALDNSVEILENASVDIILNGDAPISVGDLTISIISPPTMGTLTTPVANNALPAAIRTASVTYQHAGTGSAIDSFTFEACETPTSCSTSVGTVTIHINAINDGEAADKTLDGVVGQPVQFTLGEADTLPTPPDPKNLDILKTVEVCYRITELPSSGSVTTVEPMTAVNVADTFRGTTDLVFVSSQAGSDTLSYTANLFELVPLGTFHCSVTTNQLCGLSNPTSPTCPTGEFCSEDLDEVCHDDEPPLDSATITFSIVGDPTACISKGRNSSCGVDNQ